MGSIKSILVDLLNGFSVNDLPLLFLQIFTALVLSYITLQTSPMLKAHRYKVLLFIALFTLLVAVSKESIHFSVLLAGMSIMISILIKDKLQEWNDIFAFSALIMFAFCCGFGFIIPLILVVVIIVLPLLWMSKKS